MRPKKMHNDIRELYFQWLNGLIFGNQKRPYTKLLRALHDTPFQFVLEMDQNRETDGVALRYRFGYENDISGDTIADAFDGYHCSVLEMMTALCIRCEEQIIDDIDIQKNIEKMFMDMICSLGLLDQTDIQFDYDTVVYTMERFLNRRYAPNGRGGLFTNSRIGVDMRKIEIWYQMCFYLDGMIF